MKNGKATHTRLTVLSKLISILPDDGNPNQFEAAIDLFNYRGYFHEISRSPVLEDVDIYLALEFAEIADILVAANGVDTAEHP